MFQSDQKKTKKNSVYHLGISSKRADRLWITKWFGSYQASPRDQQQKGNSVLIVVCLP